MFESDKLYDLGLVVPAYNEEARLPIMMDYTLKVLTEGIKSQRYSSVEILIVNDGSKDNTLSVI